MPLEAPTVEPPATPAPSVRPAKPRIEGDPDHYYLPEKICPAQRQDAADGGRPR